MDATALDLCWPEVVDSQPRCTWSYSIDSSKCADGQVPRSGPSEHRSLDGAGGIQTMRDGIAGRHQQTLMENGEGGGIHWIDFLVSRVYFGWCAWGIQHGLNTSSWGFRLRCSAV
jgi:hypothetical protein